MIVSDKVFVFLRHVLLFLKTKHLAYQLDHLLHAVLTTPFVSGTVMDRLWNQAPPHIRETSTVM